MVPGWADAPLHARVARAAPVAVPVVVILAILSWNFGYVSPRTEVDKNALAPLLGLETEISSLRMTTSQQQLAELTEQTAAASRMLVSGPSEVPGVLQKMKAALQSSGWDVTFQIADVTEDSPTADRLQITYLPVRAKFKPQASNATPFTSFLAALEQLSSNEKRIDLTRVAIRVDETHWQPVEVNLRLICPVLDAKTL